MTDRIETTVNPVSSRVSFDVDSQKSIYQSLERTLDSVESQKNLFLNLTSRLDKFFAIHKASYSVYSPEKNYMRVPLVYQQGETRTGVVISIAGDKSLMRTVLENGEIYVEDFPRQIAGNIVERKLLLLEETSSMAIVPLIDKGVPYGTLNFASAAPFAFSIFSSQLFDYLFSVVAEKFGRFNRE